MRRAFRTTTALVASFSIAMGHVPVAAIAQAFDPSQCLPGEDEATCLARVLEEAAAAEAADENTTSTEAPADADTAPASDDAAAAEAAQAALEAQAAQEAAEEAAATEAARAAEEAAAAEAARAAEEEAAAKAAEEAAAAEAARAAEKAAAAEAARAAEEAAAAEAARAAEEAAAAEAAAAQVPAASDDTGDAEADSAAGDAAAVAPANPAIEAPAATVEPAQPATPATPATDAGALADALEAAAEPAAEAVAPDALSPEDQAALAAAQATASAAEEAAATPADPVAEAEAQIAEEAATAEQSLRSLALEPETSASTGVVREVITEDTARRSDEDFGRIVTAEPEAAPAAAAAASDKRDGLTGVEGLILGGIAGLVVGAVIAGNRQVVNRSDDRVVVLRPEGDYQVLRDDDTLLRRAGSAVVTEGFPDGSSRSVVTQPDGTQVITVRDPDLRILRRTVIAPDGTRYVLIDDTAQLAPVTMSQLPQIGSARPVGPALPSDSDALARALEAQVAVDRGFSLAQIRSIRAVRDLAPAVNLQNVTFATGSAAISPDQAAQLLALGRYMSEAIRSNPREVFFIEGHTDAVGSAAFNLALSDRRAETVARALTEYFGVPPQNMVIQGYGEEFLLVPTLEGERLNRRVAVRRITDLLRVVAAN